ncbi:MAG: [protein-PII] uridylyltransferase [Hyphomonadaceae bacterium]|nr:[protein-PII] uridylyltransferase [Hyphomonadaceae bacterium]
MPVRRAPGKWRLSSIIDGVALRVKLSAAALSHAGDDRAARKEALDILHGALFRGRLIAQERLQQGADGLDTARLLAAVQDEVLHALYDFTTTHVFRARNPTEGERLAVFATGGYGRSVLAPSSDIDLLFIRSYKASAHAESVIEYMLYALWDMGLKVGHAFRMPQECVRLSREDVTIKTSLLDARFLFGDRALADETADLFNKQVVEGEDAQFIADKLEERDNRHARQGNARYLVEPNVKESKGGLRDLQTLYWIVKHMHPESTETLEDVMKSNVFTEHEYHVFLRAARFLWTVRCHLHYITGRPEERLSFDLQPEIAARMGYQDRGEQLGVERFMKRYFLAAKDVGGLTRILAAKLEAQQKAKPEGWRRFLPGGGQSKNLDEPNFKLSGNRVDFSDRDVALQDPKSFLKLFQIADQMGVDVHPDALTVATRNNKLIHARNRVDPEMIETFLDILLDSQNLGLTLNRLNEAGVLGRFLPEFGGIVAQTQFNMYHHYTVDEHTIRALDHIAQMDAGEDGFGLAKQLYEKIENRRALYLAMLLHDTGKGLGDQQIEGMKTARAACKRLGLDTAETELVAWLVGNHLEMSETAQKRDISDPRTIVTFAEKVMDLEHLRLLYILTVADIRAVGPNVWNAWKGQLLGDLYHNTEAALRGGRTDETSVTAELKARAEANQEIVQERVGKIPQVMLEMDEAYWTGFEPEILMLHAERLSGDEDIIVTANARGEERTILFVSAPDRVGLFARLTQAIGALGAQTVSAQVYTGPSGRIIDVFILEDGDGEPFAKGDRGRLDRLQKMVLSAIDPDQDLPEVRLQQNPRKAAFIVQPRVTISEDASQAHTVIDVSGRDRPGLLSDVSKVLAGAGISIVSAHVGSYGERVFDAFYVKLPDGFDEAMKSSLRDQLLAALGREEPDGPSTPARKLKRASAADSF